MRALHPLTALRDASRYALRYGMGGFVLGGIAGGAVGLGAAGLALGPLGVLVGVALGVARWRAYRYELAGDTLTITSGVLRRQRREIPLRRVQNVDVTQGVFARLAGLAVLRIETAGGGATEAELGLVTRAESERLRADLRAWRRGEGETAGADAGTDAAGGETEEWPTPGGGIAPDVGTTPADPGEETLFEMTVPGLLVMAAVRFRPGSLPLTLLSLPVLERYVTAYLRRLLAPSIEAGRLVLDPRTVLMGVAGLAAVLALAWLISVAITVTRYYGFRLTRGDEELRYERGLLQRYSGAIPLDKVQAVSVGENVLMRRFGYAALTVETAGYAPGSGESGGVPSAVPLADRDAVVALVDDLEGVDDLSVERPPRRARRRYAGRYAILAALLAGVAYAVGALVVPLGPWWALPLAGVAVAPVAGHLKWANRGHRADEDHLLTRTGVVSRTTHVVPYGRLQTAFRTRTVFQRRWGLASCVADTAASGSVFSRSATAYDLDDERAAALLATLRERLQVAVRERAHRERTAGSRRSPAPPEGDGRGRPGDGDDVELSSGDGEKASSDGESASEGGERGTAPGDDGRDENEMPSEDGTPDENGTPNGDGTPDENETPSEDGHPDAEGS
jgi:putative membrane protein